MNRPAGLLLVLGLFLVTAGLLSARATLAADLYYTAGTGGYLEAVPSGEQLLGGLTARSTVLQDRTVGSLVVEAGGLFNEPSPLESARARLLLECMVAMDYDIVHFSARDLAVIVDLPMLTLMDEIPLQWVATNLRPRAAATPWPASTFARFETGGVSVLVLGVVGIADVPQNLIAMEPVTAIDQQLAALEPDAATVVLVLSDLDDAGNRALLDRCPTVDVLIPTRPTKLASEHPRVAASTPRGMAVGRITFDIVDAADTTDAGDAPAGYEVSVQPSRLAVDAGQSPEDPTIRLRLIAFYDAVAANHPIEPIDGRVSRDLPGSVRYVGAQACAQCHAEIFSRWQHTPHAGAYLALLESGDHFRPDCLLCHTTGLGHPTGFRPNGTRPQFAGVQCESCHGPGSVHTRLPGAETIRREASDEICRACHTDRWSPDFTSALESYRAAGLPHGEPPTEPGPLIMHRAGSDRLAVELFVMSLCPFGAGAERTLIGLKRRFGARLDLNLHYIVRDVAAPARQGGATRSLQDRQAAEICRDEGGDAVTDAHLGFTSLHGAEEIEENLRQIAIARLHPDASHEYLLHRADDLTGDWRAIAARLSLDAGAIEREVPQAVDQLVRDAEIVRRLGIAASPTLMIGGLPYDGAMDASSIARRICENLAPASGPAAPECDSLPACVRDLDCRDPEREGRCLDPGTAAARCAYAPAPRVTLHVFNDPTCGLCNPSMVVASAMDLLPELRVVTHDVSAGEGQPWIDAFGIDTVPSFVLEGIERSVAFEQLESILDTAEGADGYRLSPDAIGRGPLYFRRPLEPAAMDVFLRGSGSLTQQMIQALSGALRRAPESTRVTFHHLLERVAAADPDATWIVQREGKGMLVPASALLHFGSRLGEDDVQESRRQACIGLQHGDRLLDYLTDRAAEGPDVGDWRQRATRLSMAAGKIGMCALSGAGDPRLEADRLLADSLAVTTPAILVGNRLRFDGLGPWNQGAFHRALARQTLESRN